jgi:hypothetical protein
MRDCYELVSQIKKQVRLNDKHDIIKQTYGAKDIYFSLVKKIVERILNKKNECVYFEAGVGTGKIIKEVMALNNKLGGERIKAIGCDIFVDPVFINSDINIYEGTLYNSLMKIDDNSIDIFYWNDVMEHIPIDETHEHIKLIKQKLAVDAFVITITPNRLRGPCDITSLFEPRGSEAKGTHFHEYTFKEVLELYKQYNMVSAFGVWVGLIGYFTNKITISRSVHMIDKIKYFVEHFVVLLPWILRRLLIGYTACAISVVTPCDIKN